MERNKTAEELKLEIENNEKLGNERVLLEREEMRDRYANLDTVVK